MLDPKTISKQHSFECVALVVDINASEKLIAADDCGIIGQFFRDLLYGSIRAVEESHGSVISFTGDGLIAVLPSEEDAGLACMAIAHDLRKTRDYLESSGPDAFPQLRIGVGLKIAVERGCLEVSSISSNFLGEQPFLVGPPTVYATRISCFGKGDRCIVGPKAAANWPYGRLEGPYKGKGKHREVTYEYYLFDLSDLWVD